MSQAIGRREMIGVSGLAGIAMVAGAWGEESATPEKPAKRKIISVNCSPRAGKTTGAALELVLAAARESRPDIDTELIELGGLSIPAQLAAGLPLRPGETDDFPALIPKFMDPSVAAIVVGSPVYFGNMSALCKAFLDRCMVFRKDGFKLANKFAAALAVGSTRNGGQELTVQSIHTALMGQNVIIVGTGQPSVRIGATLWNQDDAIEADEFGKGTARDLGRHLAELIGELS